MRMLWVRPFMGGYQKYIVNEGKVGCRFIFLPSLLITASTDLKSSFFSWDRGRIFLQMKSSQTNVNVSYKGATSAHFTELHLCLFWTNKTNKQKLIHTDNSMVVTRRKRGGCVVRGWRGQIWWCNQGRVRPEVPGKWGRPQENGNPQSKKARGLKKEPVE